MVRDSIRQHALTCADNANTVEEALALCNALNKEIDYRIKQYAKCLSKVTKNYTLWLKEDYKNRLKKLIRKVIGRRELLATAV